MTEQAKSRWRPTWHVQLGVVAVIGFVIRLVYVAVKNPYVPESDALYYYLGGVVLADGKGFINGIGYVLTRGKVHVQSAFHPPAYTVFLAIPSLFGFNSVLSHQVWTCALSGLTIVVVGFLGREVGGPRVGLFAAALAAVYPNLWFSDVYLLSESLTFFAVAAISVVAYSCWHRPTLGRMVVLGLACGLATLSHADSILFLPLLGGSLVVLMRGVSYRRRLALFAATALATMTVVAPWVVHNWARFDHHLILTTSAGELLLEANCKTTYSGDLFGYYDGNCVQRGHHLPAGEAEPDLIRRRQAFDFISQHRGRFTVVAVARIGRTWALYRPWQGIHLDHVEAYAHREIPVAVAGLAFYYVLAGASVAGVVILRRRGTPTFPLLVPIVVVTVISGLTFGQTRYRAAAEVSLVVLAAVAFEAVHRALVSRNGDGPPADAGPAIVEPRAPGESACQDRDVPRDRQAGRS